MDLHIVNIECLLFRKKLITALMEKMTEETVFRTNFYQNGVSEFAVKHTVREPAIGLIKWLRPKGLKMCSYVEKCAEFKNQTLTKIGSYSKVLCSTEYPGVGNVSK